MKIPEKIYSLINEKVNEQNRNYILIGIFVCIFVVDYFAITMWQVRALSTLNPKVSTLSKDLKQAQVDIKNVNQYRAQGNQLKNRMSTVGAAILSKEEIPVILDSISSLAKEFNVKINQVAPLKEEQKLVLSNSEGQYFVIPISVRAKASYHNLGRFFNAIESNDIFMSISDFSIASTNDDPLRHQVSLTIRTFVNEKTVTPESK